MDGIKTVLNILCSARLKVKARPGFGRALSKMLLAVAIRQKAPPQSSVEEEKTQRGREENDCTKGKKSGRPVGRPPLRERAYLRVRTGTFQMSRA